MYASYIYLDAIHTVREASFRLLIHLEQRNHVGATQDVGRDRQLPAIKSNHGLEENKENLDRQTASSTGSDLT